MNYDKENRIILEMDYEWRFKKDNEINAQFMDFDDSEWEIVRVPHDWAIKGSFNRNNDLQICSVKEDGINKDITHTGRTGGLPISGTGWYRKTFFISEEYTKKRVFIEFDGVMANSTIFLNGKEIGNWPYGYSSFSFELTKYILFGEKNILAVKVSPKSGSSRWYTGAGIYRKVRLVIIEPVHIEYCGTYITTSNITERNAVVNINTNIINQSDEEKKVDLSTLIIAPNGQKIAQITSTNKIIDMHTFCQEEHINMPLLWDIESTNLYKAVSIVSIEGKEVDKVITPFGIRSIAFNEDEGFFLNGKNLKLKGVCLHHDLGALGAAVNIRAIKRRLEMLKDMGCNAIRTSHNPPAIELLDLCDEMGFFVIDEAFDEWGIGKVPNGYHQLFKQWAEKDLRAMIKRDRNHPCIIMWSIGNEIREQEEKEGAQTARFLTDICHAEDNTRPVTAAFNNSNAAIENGLANIVDIPGWNYKPHLYEKHHKEYPKLIMYGSETESCVSSRGEYYLPVKEEKPVKTHSTLHVNSYDMSTVNWGYAPEYEFNAQEKCKYILGEFVWTGFDYLGEPSPYREEWPSRSSYFGIIDLCGIPKDRYYLYKSFWSNDPTLHLLPHWNWEGHEGENIPVHCYTNYDCVELFLNDKTVGIRKKNKEKLFGKYRLIWDDVRYEPGTLKAVAYDVDGNEMMIKEVKTSDVPAAIKLEPDCTILQADGEDLCHITVQIVDEYGNLCPKANNLVTFVVEGCGEIIGVDNGDQTSVEPFISESRKTFNGMCMLIIRSIKERKGKIRIMAKADGILDASLCLKVI